MGMIRYICVIHHPTFGAAYILVVDEIFIWASGPSGTLY